MEKIKQIKIHLDYIISFILHSEDWSVEFCRSKTSLELLDLAYFKNRYQLNNLGIAINSMSSGIVHWQGSRHTTHPAVLTSVTRQSISGYFEKQSKMSKYLS